MKVIVEVIDGSVYCYREKEHVYKKNKKLRHGIRLKGKDLDNNCSMDRDGLQYVVIQGNVLDEDK